MLDLLLICYMVIGCVVSLVIVYNEIFEKFAKTNENEILAELVKFNPDLRVDTRSKIKLWIYKEKKYSRVFIYPNMFQYISKISLTKLLSISSSCLAHSH